MTHHQTKKAGPTMKLCVNPNNLFPVLKGGGGGGGDELDSYASASSQTNATRHTLRISDIESKVIEKATWERDNIGEYIFSSFLSVIPLISYPHTQQPDEKLSIPGATATSTLQDAPRHGFVRGRMPNFDVTKVDQTAKIFILELCEYCVCLNDNS